MLDTLKEHFAEFAADAWLKHVMPSIVAACAAQITRHIRWVDSGRPVFSEVSIQAITALAVMSINYTIHLWFFLKRKAAEKAALERR